MMFWKKLKHNQFWKKSLIKKTNWYNVLVELTDQDHCWLLRNINWQVKEIQDILTAIDNKAYDLESIIIIIY